MIDTNSEDHKNHNHHKEQQANVIDPVCGMSTGKPSEFSRYDHDGKPYYFCSEHCLTKFKKNPDGFSAKESITPLEDKTVPGSEYTCPMHPEIVQDKPGSCPKCGMAPALAQAHVGIAMGTAVPT